MTHRSIQLIAVLAAGMLAPATALANAAGKTGATSGCGGCHGSTASTDTTVSFSASATEVDAGDTVTITYTVANSGMSAFGMNVDADGGTFTAGTGTQVSGGEVTHNGKSTSDTFTFDWTAPSAGGTYTLTGAGNAVDNNGSASSADEWNVASDLEITVCVDNDGDGFSDCDGDCDDSDAARYPGNPEICDGIDNDCNSTADDGLATNDYYTDGDGDGFGAGSVSLSDCATSAPSGYSDVDTDCDDADATAFPGNPEVCDEVDNDCNSSVDDGLAANDYYTDGDGDGYGAGSVALSVCDASAPSGYSATDDDCDDADNLSYPGAPEACDGVDNDCDTVVDNGAVEQDWYPDLDSDGYGDMDADAVSDCVQPTDHVLDNTDCDDTDGDAYPGATDAWYDGVDSDCAGDSDYDADLDGYDSDVENGGGDCDDADADINPDAEDTWYDGIDSDCAGNSDYDADEDGFDSDEHDGEDCDDTNADINPDERDTENDGVDSDCDGYDPTDADEDGVPSHEDCDDEDPLVSPEEEELPGDGIDNDCNPDTTDDYEPVADVQEYTEEDKGCATASAPLALGAWAGVVSLFGLVRRRRES